MAALTPILFKSAFGRKPDIPGLPVIDPNKIQTDTIKGNQAALPGAQRLGSGIDTYNFGQFQKALDFWSPGALPKIQDTIAAQLRGELDPQDTQALIRNATAAGYGKGLGSTFGPGGLGRNLVLRDLGLSVGAQRQKGLANLMNLYASGPKAFDVTSMFFTPQQRLDFAFQDRTQRFQRDLLAAQVAAAPDPRKAAIAREVDREFNTAMEAVHYVGSFWATSGAAGGMG